MPANPDKVFASFPVLHTQRLVLRQLQPEDVKAVFALFSDPQVTRYYDLETFTEPAQAEELVYQFSRRFSGKFGLRWAIAFKGQPEALIGTCGYNLWDPKSDRGLLGYDLARIHWRQGLMREALTAMLDFGFGAMALNRAEALTFVDNNASQGLLEKMGFKQEGILRQYLFIKGAYTDMATFSLLRTEYAHGH